MANEVWTAKQLVELIERRYPTDTRGYNPTVILKEVADGVGYEQDRWIDVSVFQMWKTNGLTRAAFEIKVSRQDFLNELSHPEKHQWAIDCFHEFWFVAPENIIHLEELPKGIGFMYPRGDKLCVKRHASRNPNPKLDDVLLASFMRSAHKVIKQVCLKEENDILANSKVYQRAKIYEDATQVFFNSRHIYCNEEPKDKEKVISWLEESTKSNEIKIERDHLLEALKQFENNILDLTSDFISISQKALLARDNLGNLIYSAYGGNDKVALDNISNWGKRKPSEKEIIREKFGKELRTIEE